MASSSWIVACALLASDAFGAEAIRIESAHFESHGVTLAGSIAFPVAAPPHAAVVFIHGSGKQTRNLELAQRLARAGIAALVYDKRGAGESGGEYEGNQSVSEQNISLLADDAVAALNALAAHPSLENVPLGFTGISQAGWIAPLAARRSGRTRFLLLWSGPVCKVSEEDIYSIYTHDADTRPVPSYATALASREEPYLWPAFLGVDTDPATSLRELDIPGFWIFGDGDGSIPVDLSIARLKALRDTGHHYDDVLVPGAGHNNIDATFEIAVDWIRRVSRPD